MVAGARPQRLAFSGVDALTASERRVAELAVRGLRNREIAEALFVSLKTVEVHLGRVYTKLGIKGRSQLAEALMLEVDPLGVDVGVAALMTRARARREDRRP